MDKFGIFNLINSLFSAYSGKKEKENPAISTEEKPKTLQQAEDKQRLTSLIKTAKSHDEFVKRVYNSNKKTPN